MIHVWYYNTVHHTYCIPRRREVDHIDGVSSSFFNGSYRQKPVLGAVPRIIPTITAYYPPRRCKVYGYRGTLIPNPRVTPWKQIQTPHHTGTHTHTRTHLTTPPHTRTRKPCKNHLNPYRVVSQSEGGFILPVNPCSQHHAHTPLRGITGSPLPIRASPCLAQT